MIIYVCFMDLILTIGLIIMVCMEYWSFEVHRC